MVHGSPLQVFSATRVHFPADTSQLPEVAVKNLQKYATSTHALGVAGAIAVNSLQEEIKAVIAEAAPYADIEVLHVPVWGAFVPALNTLLGEAQRRSARYILFQSLEVACDPAILRKMLDFHTSDTLVVGPVLNGHIFTEGRRELNGRTTPWNTLALWSTRKLGLTGFLSIAEGLPDGSKVHRQISGDTDNGSEVATTSVPAMGSESWWNGGGGAEPGERQTSVRSEVPAGVEEVTAIALLQHLLGEEDARAILIDLPKSLESKVTWKTKWDGDEKRRQWHEHKMNTKITRPAAQIKQLFGRQRQLTAPLLPRLGDRLADDLRGGLGQPPQSSSNEQQLKFGVVYHYGESISPPLQVELICMVCTALFMANFSSSFSVAFKAINGESFQNDIQNKASTLTFMFFLLAGVYLPMPISLVFIRWLCNRAGHKSAMMFYAGSNIVSHVAVALVQMVGKEQHVRCLLIGVRLFEGLGAGVLFQTRFILSQMSTQDKHMELQAKTFLAGDLGLGIGALLPYVCAWASGMHNLDTVYPEIMSSCGIALASFVLLVWIWVSFPQSLHRLSSRVRFPPATEDIRESGLVADAEPDEMQIAAARSQAADDKAEAEDDKAEADTWGRVLLLVSGTLRVFVQSAAGMAVAIYMRDAGDVGFFRQSRAVAMLCLIPVPFEAFAAGIWFKTSFHGIKEHTRKASFVILAVLAAISVLPPMPRPCGTPLLGGEDKEVNTAVFLSQLILLQICLAFAAPLQVSKLYKHRHAERSLVTLEWAKAYVGRLLGPMVAIVLHDVLGYGPLLAMLFSATAVVAATA